MDGDITGLPPARTAPATPAAARRAEPPAPDQGSPSPVPPNKTDLLVDDLLLGQAFTLLRDGAKTDLIVGPLATSLKQAPVSVLKVSYQAAREALTEQMYDPKADPRVRGSLGELVNATMGALRANGIDPLGPPNKVHFGPSQD